MACVWEAAVLSLQPQIMPGVSQEVTAGVNVVLVGVELVVKAGIVVERTSVVVMGSKPMKG